MGSACADRETVAGHPPPRVTSPESDIRGAADPMANRPAAGPRFPSARTSPIRAAPTDSSFDFAVTRGNSHPFGPSLASTRASTTPSRFPKPFRLRRASAWEILKPAMSADASASFPGLPFAATRTTPSPNFPSPRPVQRAAAFVSAYSPSTSTDVSGIPRTTIFADRALPWKSTVPAASPIRPSASAMPFDPSRYSRMPPGSLPSEARTEEIHFPLSARSISLAETETLARALPGSMGAVTVPTAVTSNESVGTSAAKWMASDGTPSTFTVKGTGGRDHAASPWISREAVVRRRSQGPDSSHSPAMPFQETGYRNPYPSARPEGTCAVP